MNMVVLIGNLGRDAELRYTPSGAAVLGWTMATTETWKDKQGVKQEHTEWHRCSLWGSGAETLGQYLTKGKTIAVDGQIRSNEYTDKDGAKKRSTEIRVRHVTLLGGGGGGGASRAGGGSASGDEQPVVPGGHGLPEDDIPF